MIQLVLQSSSEALQPLIAASAGKGWVCMKAFYLHVCLFFCYFMVVYSFQIFIWSMIGLTKVIKDFSKVMCLAATQLPFVTHSLKSSPPLCLVSTRRDARTHLILPGGGSFIYIYIYIYISLSLSPPACVCVRARVGVCFLFSFKDVVTNTIEIR